MLVPRRETRRVRVWRVRADEEVWEEDWVAAEEPLEIRVTYFPEPGRPPETRSVSVTMRTPGDDFELAAGFLFTEGLVAKRGEIRKVTYCSGDEPQEYNLVEVRLTPRAAFDPSRLQRNFYMTSSCGVCGKASLDAIEVQGCTGFEPGGIHVAGALLTDVPDRLRESQPVFSRTGGIHAAALFRPDGTLEEIREDVGRHNAVDKLVGHAFLQGGTPLSERFMAVSGRASFELLQKALVARIPMVVAVGAPSSLAVDLARRFGMTLVGFVGEDGYNVYAGEERVGPA